MLYGGTTPAVAPALRFTEFSEIVGHDSNSASCEQPCINSGGSLTS